LQRDDGLYSAIINAMAFRARNYRVRASQVILARGKERLRPSPGKSWCGAQKRVKCFFAKPNLLRLKEARSPVRRGYVT